MTEPLDMSKDPDRFDPDVEPGLLEEFLEPPPMRGDETLVELLGDGAQVEERDPMTWLYGLIGVLSFLALFSLLIQLR